MSSINWYTYVLHNALQKFVVRYFKLNNNKKIYIHVTNATLSGVNTIYTKGNKLKRKNK